MNSLSFKTSKSKLAGSIGDPLKAEKMVLPNGLSIITCEDHSAPVTSVQIWAKTGSIHEADRLGAGLSHILEHMLFKGTEKRKVADISRQVEAYGGGINAYTTWDRTVYHIDIPSEGGKPGSSKGTEMAIDILGDAIMNSTLPPQEYKLEKTVILRELAMNRDNPGRQASELFFSTVYAIHPSRHPVIGYEEVYKALTPEDVMKYYKERYVPNNLLFVVVGDINTEKVRAQITALMGGWKRRALPDFFVPDEPPQVSQRIVIEDSRTSAQQTRIHLGYATCDFRSKDAAPLEILAIVAGAGMSSRLYQNLREKEQLVQEIDAWSHTPAWRGVFGVSAVSEPEKADAARAAILKELEVFRNKPISREELAKALKMVLSNHLSGRKTMSGQASELASNEMLTGDLFYSDKYLEDLQAVTPADVLRVAKTYFVPNALSVAVLQPKGSQKKAVAPTAVIKELPVEKSKLSNGLTLLTKEEKRLPFVQIRLVMKSGLLFEKAENNGISNLTAQLLLKGTTKRSAEEIVQSIESVGGSISTFSGSNSVGISIEVMESDLENALNILSDIIANPKFSNESLAREQEAQISDIKQEKEEPLKIAVQNCKKSLFGSHPYSLPILGTEASVKSIKRNDVQDFWSRVANPSNMVLAIYGHMDSKKTREWVDSYLGSLKGNKVKSPELAAAHFDKSNRVEEIQDKEQTVIVIGFPGIDVSHADRPALEMMISSLSGMGARLFYRLRDQMALCYYVAINQMIGIDKGFIYYYIGTDPAKADQAEKEILSEIQKLQKEGITEEELDRAKQGLLGERKMQKQNLGGLATAAALDELYGLGYDYSDKLEAAYLNITAKQVQAAAQKYLSQPSVISLVKPELMKPKEDPKESHPK